MAFEKQCCFSFIQRSHTYKIDQSDTFQPPPIAISTPHRTWQRDGMLPLSYSLCTPVGKFLSFFSPILSLTHESSPWLQAFQRDMKSLRKNLESINKESSGFGIYLRKRKKGLTFCFSGEFSTGCFNKDDKTPYLFDYRQVT